MYSVIDFLVGTNWVHFWLQNALIVELAKFVDWTVEELQLMPNVDLITVVCSIKCGFEL